MIFFLAALAMAITLSTAKPVPYTFHNGTAPSYEVDFWSGIACSGVHLATYKSFETLYQYPPSEWTFCARIPYPGVTGAATFRGNDGFVFQLHKDYACSDDEAVVQGMNLTVSVIASVKC